MKYSFVALVCAVCVVSASSFGASAAGAPIIVMPDQAKYGPAPKPYPADARMAVLSGDPNKSGDQYTVRLKLPSGTKIDAHTHGDTEDVTVIKSPLTTSLSIRIGGPITVA
jgi:hypothetical protein